MGIMPIREINSLDPLLDVPILFKQQISSPEAFHDDVVAVKETKRQQQEELRPPSLFKYFNPTMCRYADLHIIDHKRPQSLCRHAIISLV